MTSWLARYQQGEYEQVYQELYDCGEKVRTEPEIAAQATLVAQAMMERARQNVTLITERLRTLGYRFRMEHEKKPQALFDPMQLMQSLVTHSKKLSIDLHPDFLAKMDEMKQAQQAGKPQAQPAATPKPQIWTPPDDTLRAELLDFDRDYPLPLTLRAWFQVVGQVDLSGAHPKLSTCCDIPNGDSGPLSDPLAVWFDGDSFRDMQEDEDAQEEGYANQLELAPDALHKGGYSGGDPLSLIVPCRTFDGRFAKDCGWDEIAFIPYLRECFRWGGFPGLRQEPEAAAAAREELTFLTQGLLPL